MPLGTSITAFNGDGRVVVRTPMVRLGDPQLDLDFSHRPIFATFRDAPHSDSFAKFRAIDGVNRFVAGVGGKNTAFVIAAAWDARTALATWRADSLAITGGTLVSVFGAWRCWPIRPRRQTCRKRRAIAPWSLGLLRHRANLMHCDSGRGRDRRR